MGSSNSKGSSIKKKKEEVLKERASRILFTLEHLNEVRIAAEDLLRKVEKKDAIYELETCTERVVSRYREDVLNVLEDMFMNNGRLVKTKDAKDARKQHTQKFKGAVCTENELSVLKSCVLALETFKRINGRLQLQIDEVESQRQRQTERFQKVHQEIKVDLEEAQRGFWCREQIKQWEPERDPSFQPKTLAIHGGPKSPTIHASTLTPASPTVRLVSAHKGLGAEQPNRPRHDDAVVQELMRSVGIRENARTAEL